VSNLEVRKSQYKMKCIHLLYQLSVQINYVLLNLTFNSMTCS